MMGMMKVMGIMGRTGIMALTLTLTLTLTGCQKVDMGDWSEDGKVSYSSQEGNVWLTFTTGVASKAVPLTNQCTRLSVTVFDDAGDKVKTVVQKNGDADFGYVALMLDEGVYRVVAIAHSSQEGNCTISSLEKVTFASNKVTDTFLYYGTLDVEGEEDIEEECVLDRCVAMMHLELASPLPENIDRLKFYYTGGSSTLNPKTGYGCVNSKQTEIRYTTTEDGEPVLDYYIYTMPHEAKDQIKLTITALDEDGTQRGTCTMDNVPVEINKQTLWQGSLFGGGGSTSEGGWRILLNDKWEGEIVYEW